MSKGAYAMDRRLVAALLIALALFVFVAQNTEVVRVDLLFWSVSMSQALLVVLVLAIGMALGWLLHAAYRLHRRRRSRAG